MLEKCWRQPPACRGKKFFYSPQLMTGKFVFYRDRRLRCVVLPTELRPAMGSSPVRRLIVPSTVLALLLVPSIRDISIARIWSLVSPHPSVRRVSSSRRVCHVEWLFCEEPVARCVHRSWKQLRSRWRLKLRTECDDRPDVAASSKAGSKIRRRSRILDLLAGT